MMKFKVVITLILLCFLCKNVLSAQNKVAKDFLKRDIYSFSTISVLSPFSSNIAKKPVPNPIPVVYNYQNLALFCKLDVKLEKAASTPIFFRLGSVDYVNWLEKKRFMP